MDINESRLEEIKTVDKTIVRMQAEIDLVVRLRDALVSLINDDGSIRDDKEIISAEDRFNFDAEFERIQALRKEEEK